MCIIGTGRYVISFIYIFPKISNLHAGIIRLHVVWGTIFGNEFLQSVTALFISGHTIYIYLWESITNKNLVPGFLPIPIIE